MPENCSSSRATRSFSPSYRVPGNAVAMGQAAGVCAARAALTGLLPRQVVWSDVKQPPDALNRYVPTEEAVQVP